MADLEGNLEALFLIELLVDNVQFKEPPKSDEDLRETCVGFQFLRYPPLIVCEEDFVYMNDDEFNKTNVQFKSGKSLLFALPSLVDGCPDLGRIHVWVTRRIGRTDQTKKMGTAEICLTGSFENLLVAAAHQQTDDGPVSKFIKDTFEFAVEGCPAGTITAFIRISCFGKLIVTQFEVKGKDLFNFKGGDVGVEAGPKGILGVGKPADDIGGSKVRSGTSYQTSAFSAGPTNQPPCGQMQGMPFPGQFPGQPGVCSGQPAQYPGQFGQFPGQPAGCTQLPPPVLLSQGCQPMDQSIPGARISAFSTNTGVSRGGNHGMRGTFPCGEPRCPTNACPTFPCSHAAPCSQGNRCSMQQQQFGPPMGMMYPPGMMAPGMMSPGMMSPGMASPGVFPNCPTDRNTQVDADMIVACTGAVDKTEKKSSGKEKKKKSVSSAKKKP